MKAEVGDGDDCPEGDYGFAVWANWTAGSDVYTGQRAWIASITMAMER